MEITKDQAEVWAYKPNKKDKPIDGKFLGWQMREIAFRHFKCGRYFTDPFEKHECYHWSKDFNKKMKHDERKLHMKLRGKDDQFSKVSHA